MPQDLLSDILSTLKADQERKKQRFEQDIKFKEDQRVNEANIQHQKAEEAHQKEQIRLADQQHKEQTRQFDLVQKATKAFNDLKLVSEKNKIIETVRGGGEVAGDVKSPISKSPEGNDYTPASGIGNTDLTQHSIPIGDENLAFTSPSAKTVATQEGELEGLRNEPKYKQELSKIREQKQSELLKSIYDQGQQNERSRLTAEAANARNNASIASRERVANINKASIPAAYADYDITPHVQDALSGDLSNEDISRLPIPQILKAHILGALHDAGGKPFTKTQKELVGEYKGITDIINKMDEFIKVSPETGNKASAAIGGVLSSMNQDITTLEDEIAGRGTIIARAVAKEKGNLSNQDVKRVAGGYTSTRFEPTRSKIKKRNDFVKDINSAIDAKLSTVSPAQREIVKQKLGLNEIKEIPLPGGVGKKVKLLAPNGETRDVDESEADAYIQRGAKRVQ